MAGGAHSAGTGAGAHPWADAIAEAAGQVRLPDSPAFTTEGRRLLISLGVVRVENDRRGKP